MNAIQMSLRYIRSRKLESFLAIIGIVLGVATLAGTLSLVSSYQSYYDTFSASPLSRQISIVQSSRVLVTDDAAILLGDSESKQISFTAAQARTALDIVPGLQNFYEVQYRTFSTRVSGSTSVGGDGPSGEMVNPSSGTRSENSTTDDSIELPIAEELPGAMVSAGFFSAFSLNVQTGDLFSDSDAGLSAVIGSTLAKSLYGVSYDEFALLGRRILLNNTVYTIIGILKEDPWNSAGRLIPFNEMIFVPSNTIRYGRTETATYRSVLYSITANSSPSKAAMQLESYFNSLFGDGAVVAEARLEEFQKEVTKRQRILTLLTILAAASAFTAAINLFNLMTSRVMRRKRSIAIMRALGSWNQYVFRQIMIEAALIGTGGAVLGVALSPIVVFMLSGMLENSAQGQSIPVLLSFPVLLFVGLGAFVISLIFAALPASSAASLVITDALRSE